MYCAFSILGHLDFTQEVERLIDKYELLQSNSSQSLAENGRKVRDEAVRSFLPDENVDYVYGIPLL